MNENIINEIEKFGGRYDLRSSLSPEDQLLICKIIAETKSIVATDYEEEIAIDKNVIVNGNGNDSYKLTVKFEISDEKLRLISKLKACRFTTQPPIIASLLENFFKEWPSYQNHWLKISQTYPPRTINRFINLMVKQQLGSFKTINNPAAYFTDVIIKYGVKRKESLRLPMIADNKKL